MCIKVIQDEFLQAGRRARIDRPVPMWRQGRALLVDTMIAAAGARGGVLLSQDGEAPLQQGEVPAAAPALLQALLSTPLPVVSGGRDGVELLWSAGPDAWGPLADAARQLGLRRLLLMVLREGNSTVAWVFLVDARAPGSSRRAALQAAGGALLSHARMAASGCGRPTPRTATPGCCATCRAGRMTPHFASGSRCCTGRSSTGWASPHVRRRACAT